MGSGRDKRKKAKGTGVPGKGAEKTARKSEKNAEKATRRVERAAEGGEDDIDALLAQFKLADETVSAVTVVEGARPSPRVYGSLVPIPPGAVANALAAAAEGGKKSKVKGGGDGAKAAPPPPLTSGGSPTELVLFGGEYVDAKTDKTDTYAGLHVLDTRRNTWQEIVSPGGPAPRSSHQAVSTRGAMYVFGGEFTSRNGDRFRHYGDLWRLDWGTWRWEQLPSKGGPSPRSGHRCVLAPGGGRILLFGGFYDAGKETKYHDDLWSYDLEELRWTRLAPAPGQLAPAARGGCQLTVHDGALLVFGGYSVVSQRTPAAPEVGRKAKAPRSADDDEDDGKGIVHDDIWAYDLEGGAWERVKKAGMAPGARTSFGLVTHRDRAVLFGGVHDREGDRDKVYSELFNELYQFNLASRRWFPLGLKRKKAQGGKAKAGSAGAADGEAAEAIDGAAAASAGEVAAPPARTAADQALHSAAARIQAHFRGYAVRKAYRTYRVGGVVSELLYSPATVGVDWTAADVVRPRARAAPLMAVLKNTLWLLGGVVEIAHTDVVLDDLWSLNLSKLEGWECHAENTVGEEAFRDDDWETDSEEGDE